MLLARIEIACNVSRSSRSPFARLMKSSRFLLRIQRQETCSTALRAGWSFSQWLRSRCLRPFGWCCCAGKRLLTALNLGVERLVVCPGNHDIERAVATTFARPGTPEEADRCLSVPLAPHYEKAFQNYTEFCKALGIPSLAFGDQESYLTGVRVLDASETVPLTYFFE
jgi:hypothetical protein